MEESHYRFRAQFFLMLCVIFSNSPGYQSYKVATGELSNAEELINTISSHKVSAMKAFNRVFVDCFKRACEEKSVTNLFEMAAGKYEKVKETGVYSDEEREDISKNRTALLSAMRDACRQTAIDILTHYGSWWITLTRLHWGRNNRSLVNELLEKVATDNLQFS